MLADMPDGALLAMDAEQEEPFMSGDVDPREGGAWIGQHPDPNTEQVREELDDGAERVAVTNNEAGATPDSESWPSGHREGDPASDDDVRRAGKNE